MLPITSLQTVPGGVGFTVGENEFGPPGATALSVGDTDGATDVDDGVVLVDGASFSLELQAVSAPIPTIAAPPAKSLCAEGQIVPIAGPANSPAAPEGWTIAQRNVASQ